MLVYLCLGFEVLQTARCLVGIFAQREKQEEVLILTISLSALYAHMHRPKVSSSPFHFILGAKGTLSTCLFARWFQSYLNPHLDDDPHVCR